MIITNMDCLSNNSSCSVLTLQKQIAMMQFTLLILLQVDEAVFIV